MKRAYRVPVSRWLDDNNFKEHLENVKKNIDVIDEVSVFIEYSHHGYVELSELETMCSVAKKRLDAYREVGVKSVGINTLCTIGHLDEAWDYMAKLPMQGYKGRDGRVSKSCMCPSSDAFKEYIAAKYKLVAAARPDFIWIDDDIRIGNHGVADGCYCDKCISDFNKAYGLSESFESLTQNVVRGGEIKNKWDKFREDLYTDVCALLARTINEADENIIIGTMCSSVFRESWVKAQKSTMLRPGGGFYCDDNHVEMIKKAIDTGKQVARFSNENINDIQYEFEDFPYKRYDKSMHISAMESSFALLNGCDGVVYNFMGRTEYPEFYSMVRRNAKYWDKLTELCRGKKNVGVYARSIDDTLAFAELGFSVAHSLKDAHVAILDGVLVSGLSDDELKSVLSRGAYVDTSAVDNICRRGFGHLIGCKINYCNDNGLMERLTDDELNRGAEGYIRDPFINFYGTVPVYRLIPTDECRVLSKLITIHREEVGNAMLAFENELGGRIVASSFFAFSSLRFIEKHKQLVNIFDWLSYGKSALKIDRLGRLYPVLKKDESGDFVLMLYNPSFDETGSFDIELADACDKSCSVLNADGSFSDIVGTVTGDTLTIGIPSIKPFGSIVISGR